MPKEKTPPKHDDNSVPKTQLKKKRLPRLPIQMESDIEEEEVIEEQPISKSNAKSKSNPEKVADKNNDLQLVEVKQKEIPSINLISDKIGSSPIEIVGHRIMNNSILIEYHDENKKLKQVGLTRIKIRRKGLIKTNPSILYADKAR